MQQSDNKRIVQDSFRFVVEPLHYDEQAVRTYFAPNYRQLVDGHELDFIGFCEHMQTQKAALKQIDVIFNTIVEEGETVFTNHTVTLVTKEGRTVVIKVLAEFTIKSGQIVACDELTHMIDGANEDRDLGSRR